MWRDFLNTIDTNWLSSTKSASSKSAVLDILGEDIVQAAPGVTVALDQITWRGIQVSVSTSYLSFLSISFCVMQIRVSSLSDPPLWLMCSLLWELYELNFRYELLALDQAVVPHFWTTDETRLTRQTLLYSIFPGESGLLMWLAHLPQESCELGMCANSMKIALPYVNNFRQLLSAWPRAPPRLQSPTKLDDQGNNECFAVFLTACQFYVQTAFDFLGQQPYLPRIFSFVWIHLLSLIPMDRHLSFFLSLCFPTYHMDFHIQNFTSHHVTMAN